MKNLVIELHRRHVFKVGGAYLALAWITIQVTAAAIPALNLPESLNSIVFYLASIGFPFALICAWVFDLTPNGLIRTDALPSPQEQELDQIPAISNKEQRTTTVFNRPSIAVLPFTNLSSDTEEYFADGITEDIITELGRFPSLAVIARNSTFAFKELNIDVEGVGRNLGVQYVVVGSVRRSGKKLRISVQLTDSFTCQNIWAERYDRDLEDIFELQDEITQAIVAVLPGRIEADRAERTNRLPLSDMAAYDFLIKGKIYHHNQSASDNAEAIKNLDKAIELEPDYSHAHAWRACVLGQAWSQGYATEFENPLDEAVVSLDKAYALDKTDPECHRLLSAVNMVRKNFEKAEEHQKIGLTLSPNYDLLVVQQGELLTWMGHGAEGAKWVEKAMSLNPFHPPRFWSHLGRAHFVNRDYESAREAFRKNTLTDPATSALMAACAAYLGDSACMARYAAETLQLVPGFSSNEHVKGLLYQHENDADHHREGLIKAGLPN